MTDEQIEGAMRKGVGYVQDAVGGLTGDAKSQAKGKFNEITGSFENAYGKLADQAETSYGRAKDQADDLLGDVESIIRTQPLAAAGVAIAVGLALGFLMRGGRKTADVKR